MKHAYLILAHTDYKLLDILVRQLDDERNDIYVHIDKKSPFPEELQTKKAGLFFVEQRIDVRWGDYSVVEAELRLFELASSKQWYSYYHLLSGVDLPIKSQDYIHEFCDKHEGKLFIGFADCDASELWYRAQHWFLFSKHFRTTNVLIRGIRRAGLMIQDAFGYKRTDLEIKKGCQWCSLTHDFVKYVIESKDFIRQTFHHTFAPDEMFIQTLSWNSTFKNKVLENENEWNGCLRFVKWRNGELLPITLEDLNQLRSSNKLFARKFSSSSLDVINHVIKW